MNNLHNIYDYTQSQKIEQTKDDKLFQINYTEYMKEQLNITQDYTKISYKQCLQLNKFYRSKHKLLSQYKTNSIQYQNGTQSQKFFNLWLNSQTIEQINQKQQYLKEIDRVYNMDTSNTEQQEGSPNQLTKPLKGKRFFRRYDDRNKDEMSKSLPCQESQMFTSQLSYDCNNNHNIVNIEINQERDLIKEATKDYNASEKSKQAQRLQNKNNTYRYKHNRQQQKQKLITSQLIATKLVENAQEENKSNDFAGIQSNEQQWKQVKIKFVGDETQEQQNTNQTVVEKKSSNPNSQKKKRVHVENETDISEDDLNVIMNKIKNQKNSMLLQQVNVIPNPHQIIYQTIQEQETHPQEDCVKLKNNKSLMKLIRDHKNIKDSGFSGSENEDDELNLRSIYDSKQTQQSVQEMYRKKAMEKQSTKKQNKK